jgi:hypothetical protein
MPSNIFHRHFSDCIYNKLSSEIKTLIDKDKFAFRVGAQGPDILFYLKDFKGTPKDVLGENVHSYKDPEGFYKRALEIAKSENSDTLLPYIIGHLCHYALDTVTHPYIFFRENDAREYYKKPAHKYIHIVFESALDYLCLKKILKKNTWFYSNRNIKISKKSRNEVAELYAMLAKELFDTELTVKQISRSVWLMRFFYKRVDEITGLKSKIFRLIEKLAGLGMMITAFMRPRKEKKEVDFFNNNRVSYPKFRHGDELVNYTFMELFDQALEKGVKLVENLYAHLTNGAPLDKELYIADYTGVLVNS